MSALRVGGARHHRAAARQIIRSDDVRAACERANAAVLQDLGGTPAGVRRLFALLFSDAGAHNGTLLADALGLRPGTLNSRFARAGLPSPRTYAVTARLVVAADLLGRFPSSAMSIANALDFSAFPSFQRTVRLITGLSVTEFRAAFGGDGMLHEFRRLHLLPYLDTLRRFRQLESHLVQRARA